MVNFGQLLVLHTVFCVICSWGLSIPYKTFTNKTERPAGPWDSILTTEEGNKAQSDKQHTHIYCKLETETTWGLQNTKMYTGQMDLREEARHWTPEATGYFQLKYTEGPSIHFLPLIQFRVAAGLEPIPAIVGHEVGCTLTGQVASQG